MASVGSSAALSHDVRQQIPQHELCTAVVTLAQQALPEPIFNHSFRVYLLSKWIGEREGSEWTTPERLPLLFAACVAHDLGASDQFNGQQRFEVEGADAARDLLQAHDVATEDSHRVWVAIALHSSSGIAERIDPFTRLVRLGVRMDFNPTVRDELGARSFAMDIEASLPRLVVEKVLGNAVVKQAVKTPDTIDRLTWPESEKHPKASWPGILLRAHLENPEHTGVNPAF